jgi:hypothetical protein
VNRTVRRTSGPKRQRERRERESNRNLQKNYTMRSFIICRNYSSNTVRVIESRKLLVEKPDGNRLLGKPRHRWEYSVNIGS